MRHPAPRWQVGLVRAWLAVSVLWLVACGLGWRAQRACSAEHEALMMAALRDATNDPGVVRAMDEQQKHVRCDERAASAAQWAWLGPVVLAYGLVAGAWTVRGFRAVARPAD